jgi:amino acid transporter
MKKSALKNTQGSLGTFSGVFTPSILTILGIILFLRLGYVVGNAGLGQALIILVLANGISLLTTFSLSAIATNLKVKGGGDYYLISRTLGLEFGGAIGLVLFIAQSVSIAFYCIGFAEAVSSIFSLNSKFSVQIVAAASVGFLFIFAWLGADWATRFQYGVMGILMAALLSFFWGGIRAWDGALLMQNWATPENALPFWAIFAIFFPAVTGFTQGVSMSGDLKDPGKSLPYGTFMAVGLSIVVYFISSVLMAASQPSYILINDYNAMGRIASLEVLITAGVIAATLSSAMASFLGAPRILQSLAGDLIFPFLISFAKGSGPADNPRRGVLLSAAIALSTIALGNLNIIAPVVSMFFLISYGLLNYATYYEARAQSPSFRPRFKLYDRRISLIGSIACLGVMLAIDLTAGIIALSVLMAVYQYLKQTAGPARWADSKRSYHMNRIREHLLEAAKSPEHPRYWRPQLLIFSDEPHRRKRLLKLASWFEGEFGFTTVVRMIEGQGLKSLKLRAQAEDELRKDLQEINFEGFPLVLVTKDIKQGIFTLVQSYGIGPLQANTVMLNWLEEQTDEDERRPGIGEILYGRRIRTAFRLGCNIVVVSADGERWSTLETFPEKDRRIDVWWREDVSSQMMLLLAYILTRSQEWEEAKIRLLTSSKNKTNNEAIDDLQKKLDEYRIEAEPVVFEWVTAETVLEHSADAAIVFFPFKFKGGQPVDPFGNPPGDILKRLPVTAMVLAAEDIELDAEPEEGIVGETSAAMDELSDIEKID